MKETILLLRLFSIAATFKETTEQLFQKLKKTVDALRVNDTKLTSKNVFVIYLVLRSQKKSKNDKRTLFWDSPRSFELSLNL